MKLSRIFLLIGALFFSAVCVAQYPVSGQVVDAESKQPLEGASVFCQNTTQGTITNKEGAFKLELAKGGYELIVTYTGYKNSQTNITTGESKTITIELQKEDKSLGEVVIKSSNEVPDGWQKYGSFFTAHFIGATPFADSCKLQNPEALKFYFSKRNNKLKVLATEPLQIINKALGYNLHYSLDSFIYYYDTDINSYRGLCLYSPMEGDAQQQAQWKAARHKIYDGSRLHFLRAYYDSTLKQEGFTVDISEGRSDKKFNRLANPYDTAYYTFNDSTADAELWFPAKISITYTKKAPEKEYLQQYGLPLDVKTQISYVDLLDAITIKQNGYFAGQRSWINQGYWSWKNLADQLPYDYEPD